MVQSVRVLTSGGLFRRWGRRRALPQPIPWPLATLGVLLLLWLWLVYEAISSGGGPNGQVFGVDFSHTYAAAVIVSGGANPYNGHLLAAVQEALMRRVDLPVQPFSPTVRVGTSALFLWIWRPLAVLPYQAAAAIWMLGSYALTALGFLALLRYLGWRRRALSTLLFLATPQVVLGTYYGNVIDLVFAAVACSLPLLRRYPFVAGVLLSLATLKPQVALPIVLLIVVFHAPRKRAVVVGFCLALGARQLVTILLLGPRYVWWWLEGLIGFSNSVALQPNLASLSGFYVRWAPQSVSAGLEVVTVAAACSLTVAYWWKLRKLPAVSLFDTGPLWVVWMVATPYAHFVDEMLLAVPILALLGRDGRRLTEPATMVVLYLMILSIVLFSWPAIPAHFLWLPLLAVAACFGRGSRIRSRRAVGMLSLESRSAPAFHSPAETVAATCQ